MRKDRHRQRSDRHTKTQRLLHQQCPVRGLLLDLGLAGHRLRLRLLLALGYLLLRARCLLVAALLGLLLALCGLLEIALLVLRWELLLVVGLLGLLLLGLASRLRDELLDVVGERGLQHLTGGSEDEHEQNKKQERRA